MNNETSSLANAELIAQVLGNTKEAKTAAGSLMYRFGSPQAIRRASFEKLAACVPKAYAVSLAAMFELCKRSSLPQDLSSITNSESAGKLLVPLLQDAHTETFVVVALNRANKVMGYKKVSSGGVSSCVVDSKIILGYLIDMQASGCIISHNHPSGNLNPSQADLQITKKLKSGAELFDISLLDHVIVGGNGAGYFSMADEGLL